MPETKTEYDTNTRSNYNRKTESAEDVAAAQDKDPNRFGAASRGLGDAAAAARNAPKPKEETDPDKMSPLQRASYMARKKAQARAVDAMQ